MGLFSSKKTIGEMRFSFTSPSEVMIHDTIPNATADIPYPLWFAFLTTGKLLANFSRSEGREVLDDGMASLARIVDGDDLQNSNHSMLGVCTNGLLQIVQSGSAQMTYRSELVKKGDALIVQTHIGRGNEPHYHRATIDAVLERTRLRMGGTGWVVPSFTQAYFEQLLQHGSSDAMQNMARAAQTATIAAHMAAGADR